MKTIDLSSATVRDLNQALHDQTKTLTEREWVVSNPGGKHNLAVGLNEALSVEIDGHAGYYCAGMNQKASVTIHAAKVEASAGACMRKKKSGKRHRPSAATSTTTPLPTSSNATRVCAKIASMVRLPRRAAKTWPAPPS